MTGSKMTDVKITGSAGAGALQTGMTEDLYWFWFCGLKTVGIKTRHQLLDTFGDAETVFKATPKALEAFAWPGKGMADEILLSRRADRVQRSYEAYRKRGYHFVHIASVAYPAKLKNIYEYPVGLYYRGRLPDDQRFSVAVAGARYCSAGGRARAFAFGRILSEAGIQVISGMALGIDGSAHRGALEGGCGTFAVLGCGTDICYPQENWDIYHKIPVSGGCISEYPPGSQPLAWHFPLRNRIISGLADAVVIVEAGEKSGALITADYALEQGRDIFAVPGRPDDALSAGCNRLIGMGAGLLCQPEELLQIYGLKNAKSKKINIVLDNSEELVYSSLCLIPKNVEDICRELSMDVKEGFLVLHKLESKGVIRQVQKNQYVRSY